MQLSSCNVSVLRCWRAGARAGLGLSPSLGVGRRLWSVTHTGFRLVVYRQKAPYQKTAVRLPRRLGWRVVVWNLGQLRPSRRAITKSAPVPPTPESSLATLKPAEGDRPLRARPTCQQRALSGSASCQIHSSSRRQSYILSHAVSSQHPRPYEPGPRAPSAHSTMSELKTPSETPKWVSDLNSPPPHKSKAAGIPDPPGFPSQASGSSKVRRETPCAN